MEVGFPGGALAGAPVGVRDCADEGGFGGVTGVEMIEVGLEEGGAGWGKLGVGGGESVGEGVAGGNGLADGSFGSPGAGAVAACGFELSGGGVAWHLVLYTSVALGWEGFGGGRELVVLNQGDENLGRL